MSSEATPNSIGWFILEGFPWWPVYFCDPSKIRPSLYRLGDGHAKILKKAKDFSADFAIVYFFGSHEFSLARLGRGVLKSWGCAEQNVLLKGHPKHLAKRGNQLSELRLAIEEVEDYLAQEEDIRLPPHFVPSDLDPTLDPPSPCLGEMEGQLEGDELESEGNSDATENEESDVAEKPKAQESHVSHSKKVKSVSQKVRMENDDTKSKSEEKKKSEQALKSVAGAEKSVEMESKKKKRVHAEFPEPQDERLKKNRKEPEEEMNPAVQKKSTLIISPAIEKKSVPELSTEQLSLKLEKEIRWILENCPFEEMTTKTVRHLLQQRLQMDLRLHKRVIKAAVSKVISIMEAEEEEETNEKDVPIPAIKHQGSFVEECPKPDLAHDVQVNMREPKPSDDIKPDPQAITDSQIETATASIPKSEEQARIISKEQHSLNNHSTDMGKLNDMVKALDTADNAADIEVQKKLLQELYKLQLSTQMIIESKIGVAISKLRRSRHEELAVEASKLRKKWKSEAGQD